MYNNHVTAWIITHPHNDHITAFFDSPYWLMNGSSEKLNTLANQELIRSMGKFMYTYYTAPNWIILE